MPAKAKVDWALIEPDWRAGMKPVEKIAQEYTEKTGISVTRGAINKHFKALGIPRDLSAKIHKKAEAMVSAAMVSAKVSTKATEPSEAAIIDANAAIEAQVLLSHRKDIQRLRGIHDMLVTEMGAMTEFQELFENLAEFMADPDEKGAERLRQLYNHVIGLPARIKGVKELAETLKTLIGLEREALNITDRTPGSDENPITALIRSLQGTALRPRTIEGQYEKEVG